MYWKLVIVNWKIKTCIYSGSLRKTNVEIREPDPKTGRKGKMVGLSVSMCVAAILRGEVKEEEVEFVIGGTAAATPEHWEGVIGQYRATYWRENPDKGEEILRRLLAAGKVDQPRLRGGPSPDLSRGIWRK